MLEHSTNEVQNVIPVEQEGGSETSRSMSNKTSSLRQPQEAINNSAQEHESEPIRSEEESVDHAPIDEIAQAD